MGRKDAKAIKKQIELLVSLHLAASQEVGLMCIKKGNVHNNTERNCASKLFPVIPIQEMSRQ